MRKLLALFLLAPALSLAATIINPLPNNIQNGQPADATKVMGNFNQIVNNVNSNAAALTSSNVFAGAQSFSPATTTAQGATAGQIINDTFAWLGTAGGTANALTASATVAPAAYAAGQRWKVKASATNTGAATINISGLGVRAITRYGSTALLAGDIVINTVVELADDGTELQLLNPANVPNAATANSATTAGTVTGSAVVAGAVTSSSPTAGVGYAAGAGGSVSQGTSITTPVTLNKLAGQITTVDGTFNAGAVAAFTVNNSTVSANDTIVVSIQDSLRWTGVTYASSDLLMASVAQVKNGSFSIRLFSPSIFDSAIYQIHAIINFSVIKSVNN